MKPAKGRPLLLGAKPSSTPPQSEVMLGWGLKAELLIKQGMAQRAWGYRELAEALEREGLRVSAPVLNRRINRGNFSAAFLLACLSALGNGSDVADVIAVPKAVRGRTAP